MHVTPRNVSPHQTRFPAGVSLSGVHADGSSPPAAAQHVSPQPSSLGEGTGWEEAEGRGLLQLSLPSLTLIRVFLGQAESGNESRDTEHVGAELGHQG